MDRLHHSRDAIERLDREFIRLLAERMRAVREIGSYKGENPDAPLRDEERERALSELWAVEAERASLSPYFVGRILREILTYSRRDQERFLERAGNGKSGAQAVRVGYQGVPACYSDLAITKVFATREVGRLERTGYRTFTAAIDALESGLVRYALLPIENTIAGSINEVYDLLAARALTIVGEEVWPVEHCLVGLPGASLADVRVIRSHPVALQQCQRFLDGMIGCTAESHHDTAAAAAAVATEGRPEVAAIASEEAARAYGLSVLRREISDQPVNLTRFLLIAREPEPVDARRPSKTSLSFAVNHRRGALLRCLQAFDRQGINLTKLESRPQPRSPWEYLFYVDFEGHAGDERVQTALEELRQHVNHLKVLGSYPRRTGDAEAAPIAERRNGEAKGANGHASNGVSEAASDGAARNGVQALETNGAEAPARNGASATESNGAATSLSSDGTSGAAESDGANGTAESNGANDKHDHAKAACTVPAAPKAPENKNLKLTSLRADGARTIVRVGSVEFGGERFVLIAGPCAVESRSQMQAAAAMVKAAGASMLRGGAFKPRTSPYAFQGLGFEGLELLVEAGRAYELPVVTEVLRPEDVEGVARTADMLQIGARNMQNFSLLREVGKSDRPVLLKRGLSATIEEVLLAAEYVMAGGNNRVVICERGIRTFETATRNTLDVSAVPVLKSRTHLPVIVDPSHAAGRRDIVVPLALASAAAGADGLIVEAHPNPAEALCDKDQALTAADLEDLRLRLGPIIAAQRRTI